MKPINRKKFNHQQQTERVGIIELSDKDIKIATLTILHRFKVIGKTESLREEMNILKNIQTVELLEIKYVIPKMKNEQLSLTANQTLQNERSVNLKSQQQNLYKNKKGRRQESLSILMEKDWHQSKIYIILALPESLINQFCAKLRMSDIIKSSILLGTYITHLD